jgi:MFS transporter, OFA family, oxalate/formate antiporter
MGKRLFYGWILTWTSFSVLAISYGVQFSVGVLIPDMEADTGWTRTQISLAYSLYVLLYSSLSFVSGAFTDRYGPRRVILVGGFCMGTGYVLTGLSQELWQLYLSLGVLTAIGMSASFVPCNATVVRWFSRRRGQALAISTAGTGFGGLLLPPIAGLLTVSVGWRSTFVVLGAVAGLWLLGASRLMHRSPEERGFTVDGDPVASTSAGPSESGMTKVADLTTKQAVRTQEFWLILSLFAFTWIAIFFPMVHLSPFAESLGLPRSAAAISVSAVGVGGVLGRLVSGPLSDRIGRHVSLASVMLVQVAAFALFAISHGPGTLYPAALAFGFGYGGSTTLFPAIVADHFGRDHVGAIVGLIFAGGGSLAAIGPTAAGFLYDMTGSYRLAFVLSAGSNVVSTLLVGVLWASTRRRDRVRAAALVSRAAPSRPHTASGVKTSGGRT